MHVNAVYHQFGGDVQRCFRARTMAGFVMTTVDLLLSKKYITEPSVTGSCMKAMSIFSFSNSERIWCATIFDHVALICNTLIGLLNSLWSTAGAVFWPGRDSAISPVRCNPRKLVSFGRRVYNNAIRVTCGFSTYFDRFYFSIAWSRASSFDYRGTRLPLLIFLACRSLFRVAFFAEGPGETTLSPTEVVAAQSSERILFQGRRSNPSRCLFQTNIWTDSPNPIVGLG